MIHSIDVHNVSTNCAWVTPYREGHQFGPPRFILPNQSYKFNLDNGIKHNGAGDGGVGAGVMLVR